MEKSGHCVTKSRDFFLAFYQYHLLLEAPQPLNFESKTPGPSCATPGAFIKVRIDHLELLKADDIAKKLNFLEGFLFKDGHHLTFTNFGGQVHMFSL